MLLEVLARLRVRVLLLRPRLLVLRRVRALDVDLLLRARLAAGAELGLAEGAELGLAWGAPLSLD